MSGGGGGGQNTVSSVQQIPEFEQQSSLENQDLARSISSQAYPVYQGPLIQGQDPLQAQGQQQAINAAGSYKPYLDWASNVTGYAQQYQNGVNQQAGNASGAANYAQALANPGAVGNYMSPYIEQALAPQVQDLQLQLAQQQRGIDQQATQAGAYGDARQGAAQSLQNLYGNQAMNQLIGTGYNNAYSQALNALGQAQNTNLGAASAYNQAGGLLGQEQQLQYAGANQMANIGGQQQQLGLGGANAVYAAGSQNQQLGQQQLNSAYQQYLNQVNWPTQMLNIRESALSNSPYNIATAVTLPNANGVAQGFGNLAGIAGLVGSLGGQGGANAPYGGSNIQGTR